jgi:hypothetical protein
MATNTVLTIIRETAADLELSSGLGTSWGVRRILNLIEGGLMGAKTLTSIAARDTAVAASATITLASFAAGTVILINGVPFTGKGSAATTGNDEFDISGGTDTLDATALAAAINASTTAGISGVLSATSNAAVVTVTSLVPGLAGNAITIENLGVVATGTVTCSAVDDADTVSINGVTLTAKTTVADATVEFAVGATDTITGANLAAVINTTATSALITKHVRALNRAGVVHLFAKYGGEPGNAITLASSDGTDLAVSGARLAGGTVTQHQGVQATGTITCASAAAADTVTINGVVFTAHATVEAADQWEVSGTDTADAASLVKAINNSTSALAKLVMASNSSGVVTITSRRGGHAGNAITLASSDGTRLAVTGARLTGGAAPTVAVIAGGVATEAGGGARLASGSNDSTITYTFPS